ncbi:MAG: response regulator [Chloroflexi bacterium]|nr:response regulator [Chloroflexota bacterium]MDA1227021.1 response regulator [Chloroflexota bacterium]
MPNNILIVDDEQALREILKDVLEDAGYKTEVAESAERALEILENYSPDIIVSDVWMPGMDGHEFCRAARGVSDASILMMSGVSSEFSVLQSKQIDADDFLIKPFDVENFLERIEALIEKRQNPQEHPLDDERRLVRTFQGLSESRKELFLKEADRIARGESL